MNDLVYLKHEEAMTDSLSVAEHFHKNHRDVIRKIGNILENGLIDNHIHCFTTSKYKDASGKSNTKYLMDHVGFSLLVMEFTGKKALKEKWSYVSSFNSMEAVRKAGSNG